MVGAQSCALNLSSASSRSGSPSKQEASPQTTTLRSKSLCSSGSAHLTASSTSTCSGLCFPASSEKKASGAVACSAPTDTTLPSGRRYSSGARASRAADEADEARDGCTLPSDSITSRISSSLRKLSSVCESAARLPSPCARRVIPSKLMPPSAMRLQKICAMAAPPTLSVCSVRGCITPSATTTAELEAAVMSTTTAELRPA
mmetsp:Transcript_32088/g.74794  ORF Transcript_32088/g.74794 Transcript_32088/m.74794 type:complete len:203 (-) Transcript_32088:447-1055(-)